MNLRKILSKVVTTALIVTTVGVVQPAKTYAADISLSSLSVRGTNMWKAGEKFSADFKATANPSNEMECSFALYEGTNTYTQPVYHSRDKQNYKMDKAKTYTLQVYVSFKNDENYFGSVEYAYLNGIYLKDLYTNSGLTDNYFQITEMQGTVYMTKKLTYEPMIEGFVLSDNFLDAGDVSITGPANWKSGDTFDGSKYTATAETGIPLYVYTRLEDTKGTILYDSEEKTTPYKLEKGKEYKRWIFVYVGDGTDFTYTFGDTGKVKVNGVEFDHGSHEGEYTFGPDKYSINIDSLIKYYKTADSICDLPDELDLGVVSVDGTFDWCDGEKVTLDKFTVKSSEGYKLNKHVRINKGTETVYDSDDSKLSNFTVKEGEKYELTVFVSIDNGDDYEKNNWGYCWIGNVDALLVNGKSIKDYRIIDDSNAIKYTCTFTGGKAKPVEVKTTTDTKKDQPKVTAKKTQEVKIKAKAKTIKAKKAKKNLKIKKVFTIKGAQGTVSYQINKAKLKKQFKINKKGIITLKKKLKKGTYKVKVKVIVAGNDEYEEFSKVVTVKIKVK